MSFVSNPRRSPRAQVRCEVSVSVAGGPAFAAEAADVGPNGCQLVVPRPLEVGTEVALRLSAERVPFTLRAIGKVAWASGEAPWRAGVEYLEASVAEAAAWFDALRRADPGAIPAPVPDRIPLDARLWLGRPPRAVVDFTPGELEILALVARGVRLGDLVERLGAAWGAAQHAFFSVLGRHAVTLSRGASFPATAWSAILGSVEVEAAPPAAAPPAPEPATSPAAPAPSPAPAAFDPSLVELDPGPADAAPAEEPAPPRAPAPAPGPAPAFGGGGEIPARADLPPATVPMPPTAAALYESAREEAAAGRTNVAIAMLRQALALAPRHPDIAHGIGLLAFRRTGPTT